MAERAVVYGGFKGINEIVNKAKEMFNVSGKDRKHGSNSSCVIVEHNGNKYAVLKTRNMTIYDKEFANTSRNTKELLANGELQFSNVMKLTHKHKCHNAVPIVGYLYDDENFTQFRESAYAWGYIVQECAKGEELYGRVPRAFCINEDELKIVLEYTKKYANAPYEQILGFVNNFREIDKELSVDSSKRNNFFYDETKGFSFIDLNFAHKNNAAGNPYIVRGIVNQFRPFSLNGECSDASRKEYIKEQTKLMEKLKTALIEAKFDKGIVEEEIASQKRSIINAFTKEDQTLTR